jgi:hypothetical protein
MRSFRLLVILDGNVHAVDTLHVLEQLRRARACPVSACAAISP